MYKTFVALDIHSITVALQRIYPGRRLDFGKVLCHIADQVDPDSSPSGMSRKIAYGVMAAHSTQEFVNVLHKFGFETNYVEPKIYKDRTTNRQKVLMPDRGISLTMDIVKGIDVYDVFVICTSDVRFIEVAQYVKDRGKKFIVGSPLVPKDLQLATNWFQIGEDCLLTPRQGSEIEDNPIKHIRGTHDS